MSRGCLLDRNFLLLCAALTIPSLAAQTRTQAMLGVEAWQGKLTITGTDQGTINGLAGAEQYSVVWNMEIDVKLDQKVAQGLYWTGTVTGRGQVTHKMSIRSGDCTQTTTISAGGTPTNSGSKPQFFLYAQPNDKYSFFAIADVKSTNTITLTGSPNCLGEISNSEAYENFWPEELHRETLFNLPSSGLVISGEGSYEMPFPLPSLNVALGAPKVTPKVKVTWTFQPLVVDELILEVTSARYNDWLPTANHSGGVLEEPSPGEGIELIAELKYKSGKPADIKASHFIWELTDVSKEPGVAINWPPAARDMKDPDLQFKLATNQAPEDRNDKFNQKIRTGPGEFTSDRATVRPYDWGAWGSVKVTAYFPPGIRDPVIGKLKESQEEEIRLPKRSASSFVGDFWKSSHGVSGLPDADDSDSEPAGDSNQGDGLTLYEEYRGFYENSKHAFGNPKKKEYFANNRAGAVAIGGLALFRLLSRLEVRNEIQNVEINESRVINYLRDRGAHVVDQHAVILEENVFMANYAQAVSRTGRSGTPKDFYNIQIPPNFLNRRTSNSRYSYRDVSIAHELFHTVNVYHHAEGDVDSVHWDRDANGVLNENGAPIRTILEATLADISANYVTPDDQGLGIYRGAHSGEDLCVMRYDNSSAYKSRLAGEADVRYLAREIAGVGLCSSGRGTGVNQDPRTPQSRFGDAAAGRGNCRGQILVNDRVTTPTR